MKRVLLALVATVVGIVALLSFKTENRPSATGSGLPSAVLTSTPVPSASATTGGAPATTSAPPDPGASTAPASAKTYVGTAVQTRYGTVQIKITVAAGRITNVAFVQLTADDPRSQEINTNAAPTLLQETLTAQNADIDTVSGASYTSQGYVQSLQSALDQAGLR